MQHQHKVTYFFGNQESFINPTLVNNIFSTIFTLKECEPKMAYTLNNYLEGRETPANAIHALGIAMPKLVFHEKFPNGYNASCIHKILNLLPIENIELDVDHFLEEQNIVLDALNRGRYLKKVRVINCHEVIVTLPPTVSTIQIHTEDEILAIREIVKLENVKKIGLIGGGISPQTLSNIMDRTTWLDELDLYRTEISSATSFSRASARILNIITREVKIEGILYSPEDVHKFLYGY